MYRKEHANPYLFHADSPAGGYDAIGVRYIMNDLYLRYGLPQFIVENGMSARETMTGDEPIHDTYRIEYMRDHFTYMKQGVEDGVELWGYCCWAPIDLVSQSLGEMEKRYGMVYVDLDNNGNGTNRRVPKDSFYWYKKVIASNGEDLQ